MRHQILGATALSLVLMSCGDDGTTDPMVCNNVQGDIELSGLSIERPRTDTKACLETGDTAEERQCAEVAPDLSCLGKSEPLGTPAMVTMHGCVVAFGLGTQTTAGLSVAIFRETEGGTPVDPGYDTQGDPGQQEENTLSARLGLEISTEVPETECEDLGFYEIADIPTETPLIVRVTDQSLDKENRLQVDTYQYNILLRNSAVVNGAGVSVTDTSSCTPATCIVSEQVNTISKATFFVIPKAAGVSSIRGEGDLYDNDGQGHVAGEVQDCTSENTLQNASIAVDKEARRLTYFNVDFPDADGTTRWEYDDPKPSSSRRATNADGLYAALGVETVPGGQPITVGAAITPSVCGPDGVCMCNEDNTANPNWTAADEGEGETIPLASREVYLFPDSVTILTFDRNLYTN